MNVQAPSGLAPARSRARRAIADCDIHPRPRSERKEIHPFLEARWRRHVETFGVRRRSGLGGSEYPKSQPGAMRRDAFPPEGGEPGSSLPFMRAQLLDANNVHLGVLTPLRSGQGAQNMDLAAALCGAVNDWQIAFWTSQEPRLKGSVVIPYEDAPAAVREIERRAGDANFVQVFMQTRTAEPTGQKRYWPIFEAACAANLPIGIHAFGNGGYPISGSGWPSYYIEEMTGHAQNTQSVLTSLVTEGVFERFPKLRVALIEGGFSWLPSLAWRLDKCWRRLKEETPELKRLPSEYIREHVWLTTQPVDEPEPGEHLRDVIDWIGWDRVMFATDYPHWDYDNPAHMLPFKVTQEQRDRFFIDNARALYSA
jgi:predicted TIM-barrel fold metal-dependent hydrolase